MRKCPCKEKKEADQFFLQSFFVFSITKKGIFLTIFFFFEKKKGAREKKERMNFSKFFFIIFLKMEFLIFCIFFQFRKKVCFIFF